MMRSEKSSYMMPSSPPVGTLIFLTTARLVRSNIVTVESAPPSPPMRYFATLNDWAWLTPGHPRAAPTSTAKMGIDGLYIRLLGGCREGEDHLILRARTAARSFHAGRACKPAVRFAPIQF